MMEGVLLKPSAERKTVTVTVTGKIEFFGSLQTLYCYFASNQQMMFDCGHWGCLCLPSMENHFTVRIALTSFAGELTIRKGARES